MKAGKSKMGLIPAWLKNTALTVIILLFAGVMAWLAIQQEFDRFLAVAGVLVAIVSSPIFSVRADMEKHLFTLQTEKRYEVYRQLAVLLQAWLGNLYSLEVDTKANKFQTYHAGFETGLKNLCDFYVQYCLFFSDEINDTIHDICARARELDLPRTPQAARNEKFISSVTNIQKMHKKIKTLMRKEIGL